MLAIEGCKELYRFLHTQYYGGSNPKMEVYLVDVPLNKELFCQVKKNLGSVILVALQAKDDRRRQIAWMNSGQLKEVSKSPPCV